jgi:glycosyltransferase involved in cell wall biosynthesis
MVASVVLVCSPALVRAESLMQKVEENQQPRTAASTAKLPVTVIIQVRNEARSLPRSVDALDEIGEVYVVDSQSSDSTLESARDHRAPVVQFHYKGGWPKKRQWAMDNLPLAYDWILLLDADEMLTPELVMEIRRARSGSGDQRLLPCIAYVFSRPSHRSGRRHG